MLIMKKIVYVLMVGIIFAACTKQSPVNYTIEGNWPEGNGQVVYLKTIQENDEQIVLDSAIVENGKFKMQKILENVDERVLDIDGKKNLIILDSVPIWVNCVTETKEKGGKKVEILKVNLKGSIEQDIYKSVLDVQQAEMLVMLGLAFSGNEEKTDPKMKDAMVQMYVKAKENTTKTLDSLVNNYPNTHAAALIINNFLTKQKELSEVETLYNKLTSRIQNAYLGKKLKATIEQMKITAVGSIAPDFTLQTPEGTDLNLSSFKGKYVLLDFWASWCAPCLREVPNVKNVYDKYHEKGFEILSVSLDNNKDNWTTAIENHKLNWAHVSSLKGWKCPVVELYHVTGVPAMFLLDKEGKILAKGLRGDELEKQVDVLFQ